MITIDTCRRTESYPQRCTASGLRAWRWSELPQWRLQSWHRIGQDRVSQRWTSWRLSLFRKLIRYRAETYRVKKKDNHLGLRQYSWQVNIWPSGNLIFCKLHGFKGIRPAIGLGIKEIYLSALMWSRTHMFIVDVIHRLEDIRLVEREAGY